MSGGGHHAGDDDARAAVAQPFPGACRHSPEELNALLSKTFAKWQFPDVYDFVAEIPRTSTGKFWKAKLRERYRR